MQHLLGRAVWDADVVREDVRDYLIAHLADPSTFLVVDETGDLKALDGRVQQRYSDTSDRLVDRRLYLAWAGQPIRPAATRLVP